MRKHGKRAQDREFLVSRTIFLSMRDAQYKRLGYFVTKEYGRSVANPFGGQD